MKLKRFTLILTTLICIALPCAGAETEEHAIARLAGDYAAEANAPCPDGSTVDLLSDTHAIDVALVADWQAGLGRALQGAGWHDRTPAVALLREPGTDLTTIFQCRIACLKAGAHLYLEDREMATIETIGASGCDYPDPQAWYNAHSGDITSDPNAPYIGEMAAETFGSLDMSGSTTDATHYFHLRAQAGVEFDGNFSGSHPVLNTMDGSGRIVYVADAFTRLEHFVVGGCSGVLNALRGIVLAATADELVLDSVGVYDIMGTSDVFSSSVIGIESAGGGGTVVRNCAIGKLLCLNTRAGFGVARCVGIANTTLGGNETYRIFDNAIEGLSASAVAGSGSVYGIETNSSGPDRKYEIVNNAIGTLTGGTVLALRSLGTATYDTQNNATTDTSGGTNSQDNITPANEFADITPATLDLHMKAGGQCDGNGLNLIESSYPNAPTEDCDGETRPATGAWSIGIDYHPPLIPKIGWTLDANLPDWTLDQNHPDWTPEANLADWTLDPNPVEWTPAENLPEWTLDRE